MNVQFLLHRYCLYIMCVCLVDCVNAALYRVLLAFVVRKLRRSDADNIELLSK
jgi:hypothetical protein